MIVLLYTCMAQLYAEDWNNSVTRYIVIYVLLVHVGNIVNC